MRSWFARHPISFMALYTVFYLTAFHWLEVNITVPAIWVHCQLDDVIPFCKYAIVPYFAWFAWIPFTLFYLLRHGERSDFWRVCLCLFAGMTIALSCYLLLPTGLLCGLTGCMAATSSPVWCGCSMPLTAPRMSARPSTSSTR